MGAIPREQGHVDGPLFVLYVCGSKSIFQRSAPVKMLSAHGVSNNAPGGCLTLVAVAKPCALTEQFNIFSNHRKKRSFCIFVMIQCWGKCPLLGRSCASQVPRCEVSRYTSVSNRLPLKCFTAWSQHVELAAVLVLNDEPVRTA